MTPRPAPCPGPREAWGTGPNQTMLLYQVSSVGGCPAYWAHWLPTDCACPQAVVQVRHPSHVN